MRQYLFLAAIVLSTANAMAHGWYPLSCCSGNQMTGDCQMIPATTVKVVAGGYEVTILPGQHRLATRPHTFFVKQSQAKQSKDSDFHLCLWPSEDEVQCFFAPPFGA